MKKDKYERINAKGITSSIETTPEDGFVHSSVIRPAKMKHYGKDNTLYHKGYSKTFVYITNDPRITRIFVYGACGLFFGIGVLALLTGLWYFAIPFILMSIFAFIKSKKDIDKIAEKLKQQGCDVTIDSKEEAEQIEDEVIGNLKKAMNDVTSSVCTKNNFKWFIKVCLSIYAIVTFVTSLLIGIFVSIFLGIFIFILLVIIGFFYFYVLSKIFKY